MKIYIKPRCPWCVDALAWLQKRGIEFEVVDVLADPSGYAKMRQISGQGLAPTLELPDGSVLPDFDTVQLEKFLRARGLVS